MTDVDAVSGLLREHGALACWDYAAAGPYLPIDMRGKDAVFLSPHKFAGGPGTPGVLVAKRALFRNRVPSVPGGGTILFVSPRGHSYHPEPAIREEGGTPAIVESIRAGLVFALKDAVGAEEIHRRERELARRALASWGANPRIEILGNPRRRAARDRLARAAPPARPAARQLRRRRAQRPVRDPGAQRLLLRRPLHPPHVPDRRRLVAAHGRRGAARGRMGAKLAFTRLSFNYFISEAVFDYVLAAVHLIADEGHKLLPLYRFDPETGLWQHRDARPRRRCACTTRCARAPRAPATAPERVLAEQLAAARRVIAAAEATPPPAAERPPAERGVRAHPLVPAAQRGRSAAA